METSDSEYFESADEDFESEDDERKNSQKPEHQTLAHKIIEPELCKLKIEENQKDNMTRKEPDNMDNKYVSSKTEEKTENSYGKKPEAQQKKSVQTQPVNLINNIVTSNNGNDQDQSVNITNKVTSSSPETIITSENLEEQITQYEDILDKRKTITEAHVDKNDGTSTKTPAEAKQFELEDNLWDDDEINWSSEAAKEELERTEEHSPTSKYEDSGWSDFQADWESETTTVSDQSSKKTPAHEKLPQDSTTSLWEKDDDWEAIEKPEEKSDSGWGTWSGWGVSSLLNTATQITTQVSQGFSTVLESGIGIPDPEEMARINTMQSEKDGDNKNIPEDPPTTPVGFGLGNLVSGVSQLTKFVESTGTKVITGGLDTLEAIGKKTVEVLQEGDPGLKKKRAFLKLDSGKPNLSQILREAKERNEEDNQKVFQQHNDVKRFKSYETLFDDHQGLVHLEALEMLSKLCNIKLDNLNNSLAGDSLKDMQETMEQVKELCDLSENDEDEKVTAIEETKEIISNAVREINIPISYEKLFTVCEETDAWLKNVNMNFIDDGELHQQAIQTLAQLTALAVEQFHKTGELLLVKEHRSTADEADSLVQITTALKSLILSEAGRFTDKLSTIENSNKEKINEHITNIFYEAANSGTYIQDAFQLLIPVLQVGAV